MQEIAATILIVYSTEDSIVPFTHHREIRAKVSRFIRAHAPTAEHE